MRCYYGPDGRRYSASTTFTSKHEARAWLALRQADIIRKAWEPPEATTRPGRLTFGAYAEQWMTHRWSPSLKARTRQQYRWLLDEHLIPEFGSKPLRSITSDDVRDWFAGFGTDTPTVRAHCYGLLRAVLATAASDGKIGREPVRHPGRRDHQAQAPDPTGQPARAGQADPGDARAVSGDDPAGVLVRDAVR